MKYNSFNSEDEICYSFKEILEGLVLYNQIINPDYFVWYHIPNGQRAGGKGLVGILTKAFPFLKAHVPQLQKIVSTQAAIAGSRDKNMGALRGVADYYFSFWNEKEELCIAYIEMKYGKGTLSEHQKAFAERVMKQGCYYGVAYSPQEALYFLKEWGALKPNCIF